MSYDEMLNFLDDEISQENRGDNLTQRVSDELL